MGKFEKNPIGKKASMRYEEQVNNLAQYRGLDHLSSAQLFTELDRLEKRLENFFKRKIPNKWETYQRLRWPLGHSPPTEEDIQETALHWGLRTDPATTEEVSTESYKENSSELAETQQLDHVSIGREAPITPEDWRLHRSSKEIQEREHIWEEHSQEFGVYVGLIDVARKILGILQGKRHQKVTLGPCTKKALQIVMSTRKRNMTAAEHVVKIAVTSELKKGSDYKRVVERLDEVYEESDGLLEYHPLLRKWRKEFGATFLVQALENEKFKNRFQKWLTVNFRQK